MKNLLFIPFAYEEGKNSSVNISTNVFDTYMKNLCVSLISARTANPDIDVVLVCNRQIPEMYEGILKEKQIQIVIEPFDFFVFDDHYRWCLAFYKLNALKKMIDNYDYDNYIFTDADVFVQKPLDNIYLECRDHILLYDINEGLFEKDYQIITDEFKSFGIDSFVTHYGGEFFAASRKNAQLFVTECMDIYNEMQRREFITTAGDEFITSIAAHRMPHLIRNAGAYIMRFWTGYFYLVSTRYRYNEIAIMHLPGEKRRGFLKLFDFYTKKNAFPNKNRIYRIFHLDRQPLKYRLKHFIAQLLHKG